MNIEHINKHPITNAENCTDKQQLQPQTDNNSSVSLLYNEGKIFCKK